MPRPPACRCSTTACSTATACSRESASTPERRSCWRSTCAACARPRAACDRGAAPRRRARRAVRRGDRALRRAGRLPAPDRHARTGLLGVSPHTCERPTTILIAAALQLYPGRALRARRRRDHLEPAARVSRQRPAADQVAELPHLGARGSRGAGARSARGAAPERRRRDLRVHGRQRVPRLARPRAHATGVGRAGWRASRATT